MKSSFGSRELISCLLCLGFTRKNSPGSSHIKYASPKKITTGMRPFIIAILHRKDYDPHTKSSYLKQIQNLGYTSDQIDACMLKTK